jgi:hypothetical protein
MNKDQIGCKIECGGEEEKGKESRARCTFVTSQITDLLSTAEIPDPNRFIRRSRDERTIRLGEVQGGDRAGVLVKCLHQPSNHEAYHRVSKRTGGKENSDRRVAP